MNSAFDRMYEMTALGRPIDPRHFTNLLILILTPLVGGVAGGFALASGFELGMAARIGLSAGIITILTWILARETDHDHPWSAFLSVALALIAFYLIQRNMLLQENPRLLDTAVLTLFFSVAILRIVSRIVGPPTQVIDSVVLLIATAAVAFFGIWVTAFAGVLAFLLDGVMSKPARRNLLFALLAVVVIVARMIIRDIGEPGALTLPYLLVVVAVSAAYGTTILATRQMRVGCDLEGHELDVRRVRASMLLGLVIAVIAALWEGNAGVLKMMPLWAALLGTAVYRLPATVLQFRTAADSRREKQEKEIASVPAD